MDFIRPDDHEYANYYLRLKNSIIFSKLLKANYKERTVEIISFPIEEQVIVREFTRVFLIIRNIFETLKRIERSHFAWTFVNFINSIVTFKLIMQDDKEHLHINIKKYWNKSVFEVTTFTQNNHS